MREPEQVADGKSAGKPIALADIKRLPTRCWWIVAIAAVMTLARFSEHFWFFARRASGWPSAWVPLVMVLMSVVYALVSYPAGVLADRGRQGALLSGRPGRIDHRRCHPRVRRIGRRRRRGRCGLGRAYGPDPRRAVRAGGADRAGPDLRGTAFGLFNLVSGVALLVASALAGWLWAVYGPMLTFYAGASFHRDSRCSGAMAATSADLAISSCNRRLAD